MAGANVYGAAVRRGLALLSALLVTTALAAAAEAAATPRQPIAGVTLDGKRLALASFRGKPVVINVWSSW